MEPLAAPSTPPPPLSSADWRGGAMTIIAAAKLHTLVQVHDRPKGFFDCESFAWRRSTSLAQVFFFFFFAVESLTQNMTVAPGFNGCFSFCLRGFKQSRCPPCKQRLMGKVGR